MSETRKIVKRERPRHRVRGGRLPQYRRVLVEEARHHDDHGRHLHARLRLLQCAHRACPARSTRTSRRTWRSPSPSSGSSMSSSPRSTATTSPMAGRSISPRRSGRSAQRSPGTTIEILTPDFLRKDGALEMVVAAKPDVFNHNLETVPSNYLTVRPGARYFHSIRLLQRVKELDPAMFTKSGIMVGLGEERNEVLQLMDDLRSGGCRFPHHRAVSAADPQAPSGEALRHAGGVQVLRDGGLCQGLPAGIVEPADALVAPCRRGFRAAARGPARPPAGVSGV